MAAFGTPLPHFAGSSAAVTPGLRERLIRSEVPAFKEAFTASGTPDYVGTFDLVSLPYPTKFGLWRAALTPTPFLTITNRLLVVRWHDADGRQRTLLWEPTDVELAENTPYFAALKKRLPNRLRELTVTRHGTVLSRLAELRIDPGEVDYLVFDHLHTQDVRRLIGTTVPQPDISPDRPVPAAFPNAVLVVQRLELAAMANLSPLQRPWYQPQTFDDLNPGAVVAIEGHVQLGPGVALLETPGHTYGNQSLVLGTDTGIWVSSENAIAAECLSPEHSRIPGVARWARAWGQEVVLNANTIEQAGHQYASMVLEKLVADPAQRDGRFVQFLPSSELTRNWMNPGASPTFTHGGAGRGIRHGRLEPAL